MTRAICTTPAVGAAREFMRTELGWDLHERATVGPDPEAGVVIVEADRLGAEEMAGLPRLDLIVCVRGDPVNVDLEAATLRGVPVVHAPGRNAQAVAEFTIGIMIALLRHIVTAHELVRARRLTEERAVRVRDRRDVIWRPTDRTAVIPYEAFKGPGLVATALGVLGLGAVGRRVAALAHALGMRVLGHDPHVPGPLLGVEHVTMPELLARADVLSLHARGGDAPLIGAAELAALRPHAVLINTARATLLDYPALIRALVGRRLAAAALDVYPDEPLTADDPLLDLDNVILTPHIAGASVDVLREQWEILVAGLRLLLLDDRPEDAPVRNPITLAAFRARRGL